MNIHALVPACFNGDPFWSSQEGLSHLNTLFREIKASKLVAAHMVDDGSEACALARRMGFTMHQSGDIRQPNVLPVPGSTEAISLAHGLQGADAFLFLDPRLAGLTSGMLDNALEAYSRDPGRALVGLAGFEDHPCQWKRFSHILDAGLGLFLDQEAASLPEELPPSLPFAFAWPYGLDLEQGSFFRDRDTAGLSFHSLTPDSDTDLAWSAEDSESARLTLLGHTAKQCMENGSAVGFLLGAAGWRGLSRDTDTGQFLFPVSRDWKNSLLRLVHLDKEGFPDWGNVANVHIRGEASLSIPLIKGRSGFLYWVTSQGDGEVDLLEPLCHSDLPWQMDFTRNTLVNSVTGKDIHGRQSYPEVWQPMSSFLVLPPELANLSLQFDTDVIGQAQGWVLSHAPAILVVDMLSFLTAKAREQEDD